MSAEGASYRDAGVDYDALDAAKRLAMLGALSTSPLLGARGGPGARRLARRAGVRVRARRAHARAGARGARHEVDDRAARCSSSRASTASPTSPTTPSPRSSTTSSAWAPCRWSSTPTSPPATRPGTSTGSAPTALLEGWRRGCEDAGCVWGGGESPTLPGMLGRAGDRARRGGRRRAARGGRADPRRRARRRRRDRARRLQRPARQRRLAGAAAGRAPAPGLRHAAARRARTFGEALLDPTRDVRGAGRRAAAPRRAGQLPQPRHRPRAAEADAPERRRSRTASRPCPRSRRCSPSSPTRRAWTRPRPTRPSTWASATPSTAAAGQADGGARRRRRPRAGGDPGGRVEAGPRRVVLEPLGVSYDGSRAGAVGQQMAETSANAGSNLKALGRANSVHR